METEEPKANQPQFIENQYVKVFGIIKSLQGQKNVQAFRILPIKELNEITNHMLECMNASIYYSTKASGESMDDGPMHNSNPSTNKSGFDNNTSNAGLSGLQNKVSNLIKQAKSSEGVHLNEICSYFANEPQSKIRLVYFKQFLERLIWIEFFFWFK